MSFRSEYHQSRASDTDSFEIAKAKSKKVQKLSCSCPIHEI